MREILQRLVILGSSACLGCKTLPLPISETRHSISQADLRRRLLIVADDSMLGRSASNSGHDRAVTYIAAQIAKPTNNSAYVGIIAVVNHGSR